MVGVINDSGMSADRSRQEALEDQAQEHYNSGNLAAAEELLVAATNAGAASASIFHNLGLVRFGRADYAGAVEAYSKSIAEIPEGRLNRGLSYERIGETDAAVADYGLVLEEDPDDVDALVNLGTLEVELGSIEAAREHLEHAADLDPTANWQLSGVHVARGDLEAARSALDRAIGAGELRAYVDLVILDLLQKPPGAAENRARATLAIGAELAADEVGDTIRGLERNHHLREEILAEILQSHVRSSLFDFVHAKVV